MEPKNDAPQNYSGLVLNDISISLHGKTLIAVSDRIEGGEVLTIMGPSGSGKSTLLAFVGGFLDPVFSASGSIYLDGSCIDNIEAQYRNLGLLFQDPLLFPHMSVGGNLLFAIPSQIKGRKQRKELANHALEEAGLSGYFDRDPATLSGGQKSRVALVRVLLANPKALLLDEPFSKLDTGRRQKIRELVFNAAKSRGLPVLLVTHDYADAKAANGRIITLE